MRHQRTSFIVINVLVGLAIAMPRIGNAAVSASFDDTKPSTNTFYTTNGPGNVINEIVTLDLSAGPWLKDIVNNTASGISSGATRPINEFLTNAGPLAWTGWHEMIVSRTQINNPNDAPGFLFRANSLVVMADHGAGMIALTEGVDYTLVTTPYSGPPDPGNNSHWEAITIQFAPLAQIGPGDTLHIQKDIFEVFGDGNVWMPNTAAQIGEYPLSVPEPACLGIAAAALLLRRRRDEMIA